MLGETVSHETKGSKRRFFDRILLFFAKKKNKKEVNSYRKNVSYETKLNKNIKKEEYRPENNLHFNKLKRLSRVIMSYLSEKDVSRETDWRFDVAIVYLDIKNKEAKIKYLKDIVL